MYVSMTFRIHGLKTALVGVNAIPVSDPQAFPGLTTTVAPLPHYPPTAVSLLSLTTTTTMHQTLTVAFATHFSGHADVQISVVGKVVWGNHPSRTGSKMMPMLIPEGGKRNIRLEVEVSNWSVRVSSWWLR